MVAAHVPAPAIYSTVTAGRIDKTRKHKGVRFTAPVSPTLTCVFFTHPRRHATLVVSNATWVSGDDMCFEKGSVLVKLIDPAVTTFTLVVLA